MKRLISILLCFLILTGCTKAAVSQQKEPEPKQTQTAVTETKESPVNENVDTNKGTGKEEVKEISKATGKTTGKTAEAPTLKAAPSTNQEKQAATVNSAGESTKESAQKSENNEAAKVVHIKIEGMEGTILEKDVAYASDMTAFDATLAAVEKAGKTVVYSGGKSSPYIQGIDGLFEKDYGDMSGWIYHVNNVKPAKSSGKYVLNVGDSVLWKYETNCLE
ncbi:MAG: DUF4430 domain-containing protein [Bacillota bacterium]|nr:DUF4430 domain-containing protein [Bacillota bacterium]